MQPRYLSDTFHNYDAMRCEAAKVVGRERIRNGLSTNSNSKRLRFIHKTKTTLKTYFLAY